MQSMADAIQASIYRGATLRCDAPGCKTLAAWCWVGNTGDLYLCRDHCRETDGWMRLRG